MTPEYDTFNRTLFYDVFHYDRTRKIECIKMVRDKCRDFVGNRVDLVLPDMIISACKTYVEYVWAYKLTDGKLVVDFFNLPNPPIVVSVVKAEVPKVKTYDEVHGSVDDARLAFMKVMVAMVADATIDHYTRYGIARIVRDRLNQDLETIFNFLDLM